jgi:hypothetical protein
MASAGVVRRCTIRVRPPGCIQRGGGCSISRKVKRNYHGLCHAINLYVAFRGKRESLSSSGPLAVTCVAVGPKQTRPALFCVCTEGGEVIVQVRYCHCLSVCHNCPVIHSAAARFLGVGEVQGTIRSCPDSECASARGERHSSAGTEHS